MQCIIRCIFRELPRIPVKCQSRVIWPRNKTMEVVSLILTELTAEKQENRKAVSVIVGK